ncbi:hypothetical protein Scep_009071 [Stephania cephalantha]|uniref:Uncharacterized protein n=1 Tax=Stephania cephalantha TaxID=152367 RepID=A0AAP0PFY4_9MAGN
MLLRIKARGGGWAEAEQMGQALRRAAGRVRTTEFGPPAGPRAPKAEQQAPETALKSGEGGAGARRGGRDEDGISQINTDNVLEERDPQYDAMLSQMVGRIKSKAGGKLEMGEAFIVEKYKRPMPKLRSTKSETSRDDEPVPAGTLNVSQLKQIFLLQQGKAEDHDGSMDVQQIADKFRIDVLQVKRILQFLSLPPEDTNSEKKD